MMNNYIRNSGYYLPYINHNDIYQDDRFTDDVEIGYNYMVIRYSGYCYKWDNKTDEFIN